jgi:hypothetical protein
MWVVAAVVGGMLLAPGGVFADNVLVRGRVDDIGGRPVEGAEVVVVEVRREGGGSKISLRELARTQSGDTGGFVIDWPSVQREEVYCYLRATMPGQAYSWVRCAIGSRLGQGLWYDEQRNVESFEPRLTLLPACTLNGQVVNKEGQPVAGAEVRVHPARPVVVTDAQGRFSIGKVPPTHWEHTFNVPWVYVSHPDYLAREVSPGNGSDPNKLTVEKAAEVRIELDRGGVVRGRVMDANGGVPRGFSVLGQTQERDTWQYGGHADLGADGRFALRLPLGPARVSLQRERRADAAVDYPVQEFVAVTVREGAEVNLQVKRGMRVGGGAWCCRRGCPGFRWRTYQ